MDILLSLVMGVSLRFALDGVSQLRPVIIGVWEGLCLNRLTSNKQGPDPYLAYLLRLVLDVFISQSIVPVVLSVLWSVLSLLVLAAARHGNDTVGRRELRPHRSRHSRTSDSRRQSIREVTPPPRMAMPPLFSPRSPNAPPSPPSSFLNGDTDMAMSPTQTHDQTHLLTPPDTWSLNDSNPVNIMTLLGADSTSSEDEPAEPSENILLLPSTPSVRRLSTVPEESTVEETPAPTFPEIQGESADRTPRLSQPPELPPPPNPDIQELDSIESYPEHTPTLIPPILLPPSENFQLPPLLLPEGRPSSPPRSDPDPLLTPRHDNEELADDTDYDERDELETPPSMRRPLSPLHLTLAQEPEPEPDSASQEIAVAQSFLQNLDRILKAEVAAATSGSSSRDTNTPIPIPAPGSSKDEVLEIMSVGAMTPTEADSVITNANALAIESKAVALRAEAWKANTELSRLQQELHQAQKQKRPKDIFLIKGEIVDLTKKVEKMHKSAERRFLKARNMTAHSVPTIDIHGLLIPEAIRVTEAEFRKALLAGQTSIRVITGKGKHSKGGVAKLKPAIIEHMSRQQFVCTAETQNSGVVVLSCP